MSYLPFSRFVRDSTYRAACHGFVSEEERLWLALPHRPPADIPDFYGRCFHWRISEWVSLCRYPIWTMWVELRLAVRR